MILTKRFNSDMFTTSLRGDKAFTADQKIREFEKNY